MFFSFVSALFFRSGNSSIKSNGFFAYGFGPHFALVSGRMGKFIGNVRKSTPWQSLLLLLFLIPCLFPSSAIGESYSYTDIHPPGWIESRVTCLNGRGEAVVFGTTADGERGSFGFSEHVKAILLLG